jgi:hypothetical protein
VTSQFSASQPRLSPAGLTRGSIAFFAITLSRPCPAKGMDARDKPVHDNLMRLAQVENARRSVPATQVRAVRGVGKWVA